MKRFFMNVELANLITSSLLMKLGGQVSFPVATLSQISQEYAGYRVTYDKETDAVCFTLKTRTEDSDLPYYK